MLPTPDLSQSGIVVCRPKSLQQTSLRFLIITDVAALDVLVYIRSIRVLGGQPQDIIASSNTTSANDDKQWNQL